MWPCCFNKQIPAHPPNHHHHHHHCKSPIWGFSSLPVSETTRINVLLNDPLLNFASGSQGETEKERELAGGGFLENPWCDLKPAIVIKIPEPAVCALPACFADQLSAFNPD